MEDLKNLKFGALISKPDQRDYSLCAATPIENDLPKEYIIPDFMNKIFFQGSSSECVAFSLRWICEWMNTRELKKTVDLSEKFIFGNRIESDDSYRLLSFEGMYLRDALSHIKNDGVCENSLIKVNSTEWYDYLGAITPAVRENAKKYKTKSYARIYSDFELKNALLKVGAVLASIPITKSFSLKNTYMPLVTKEYADKNRIGNHACVVVGWKIYNNKEYWICIDSYGKESHENGIFYYEVGSVFNELWTLVDDIATPDKPKYFRVQLGAYKNKDYCHSMVVKLKNAGFATYVVNINGLLKIQMGAFNVRSNAENLSKQLKAKGFDNFITYY